MKGMISKEICRMQETSRCLVNFYISGAKLAQSQRLVQNFLNSRQYGRYICWRSVRSTGSRFSKEVAAEKIARTGGRKPIFFFVKNGSNKVNTVFRTRDEIIIISVAGA